MQIKLGDGIDWGVWYTFCHLHPSIDIDERIIQINETLVKFDAELIITAKPDASGYIDFRTEEGRTLFTLIHGKL